MLLTHLFSAPCPESLFDPGMVKLNEMREGYGDPVERESDSRSNIGSHDRFRRRTRNGSMGSYSRLHTSG